MFREEMLIIVKDFSAIILIKLQRKYKRIKLLYYSPLLFRSFGDDITLYNYIEFSQKYI